MTASTKSKFDNRITRDMALFVQQFKSNPEVYYREIDSKKTIRSLHEARAHLDSMKQRIEEYFFTNLSQCPDFRHLYSLCVLSWSSVSMNFSITRGCPAFDIKSSRMKVVCAYLRTSKSLLSKKRRKVVSKLRSCAVADIISTPFRTLPSQVWLSPFSRHSFSTATRIFLTSIIYESRAHFKGRKKLS